MSRGLRQVQQLQSQYIMTLARLLQSCDSISHGAQDQKIRHESELCSCNLISADTVPACHRVPRIMRSVFQHIREISACLCGGLYSCLVNTLLTVKNRELSHSRAWPNGPDDHHRFSTSRLTVGHMQKADEYSNERTNTQNPSCLFRDSSSDLSSPPMFAQSLVSACARAHTYQALWRASKYS